MSNKFKTLYIFEVLVPTEVDEPTEGKNDAGEIIKGTHKVKKEVSRRVALRKPTRALLDDAELYFNVLVSQGIQAGLMSRALLAKRFNNDGGVLSNPEKEAYAKAYYELEQKQSELIRLTTLKDAKNLSESEKAKIESLTKETGLLRRDLQNLEVGQLALYDITAESRARTKTILWWVLQLTHAESLTEPDVWEPIFRGNTVDEKMASYDTIEEAEDFTPEQKEFYFKAIRRAAAATAFWFYGQATKQEDFSALETEINRDDTLEKEVEKEADTKKEPEAPQAPKAPEKTEKKSVETKVSPVISQETFDTPPKAAE